ncbi:hypothetical protein D3C76_1086710 [compost metagenome]
MKQKIAQSLSDFLVFIVKLVYRYPQLSMLKMPDEVYKELTEELKGTKLVIDRKIESAFTSLSETSSLLNELEALLKERTEKLNQLRNEYEKYSELALVEQKKAEAVVLQIRDSLNQGRNIERWVGFAINIFAGIILFVLGIWLGPPLTEIILGR